MGGVNAFSRNLDGHRVTVVGEVPPRTVQMIGQHVRRAEQPALRHFR